MVDLGKFIERRARPPRVGPPRHSGELVPYYTREEIRNGALAGTEASS